MMLQVTSAPNPVGRMFFWGDSHLAKEDVDFSRLT
jgi:hypothetical protein